MAKLKSQVGDSRPKNNHGPDDSSKHSWGVYELPIKKAYSVSCLAEG